MSPSPTGFRVALGILWVVSTLVTGARLALRYRQSAWWWDDSLALCAGFFNTMSTVTWLISYFTTVHLNRVSRAVIYNVASIGFVSGTWSARISILFILMRITPDPAYQRFIAACASFFALCCLAINLEAFIICQTRTEWQTKENGPPQCPVGRPAAIAEIVCDMLSDLILVSIPAHLFLRARSLDKTLKVRLIATFATSAITTAGCLVHDVFLLRVGGIKDIIAGSTEVSTALLVCNLPVIVPALLRRLRGSRSVEPEGSEPVSELRWRTTGTRMSGEETEMTTRAVPLHLDDFSPCSESSKSGVLSLKDKEGSLCAGAEMTLHGV